MTINQNQDDSPNRRISVAQGERDGSMLRLIAAFPILSSRCRVAVSICVVLVVATAKVTEKLSWQITERLS